MVKCLDFDHNYHDFKLEFFFYFSSQAPKSLRFSKNIHEFDNKMQFSAGNKHKLVKCAKIIHLLLFAFFLNKTHIVQRLCSIRSQLKLWNEKKIIALA